MYSDRAGEGLVNGDLDNKSYYSSKLLLCIRLDLPVNAVICNS